MNLGLEDFKEFYWILVGLILLVIVVAIVQTIIGRTISDERFRILIGYWKFVFGTFIIGFVTSIINWQIQWAQIEKDSTLKNKEIELAETVQENANLSNYIEYALTKDLESRRAFAKYFSHVTRNSDAQERWKKYSAFVEEEIKEAEKKKQDIQVALEREREKTRELEAKLDVTSTEDQETIEALQAELINAREAESEAQRKLKEVQAELKSPIPTYSEAPTIKLLEDTIAPVVADELPIETGNVAKRVEGDSRLWDWTVFVHAPEDILSQIRCVEYTLHRTFRNPVSEICNRGTGHQAFALSARGWGTFRIKIRVLLKNGDIQNLVHDLRF